VKSDDVTGRVKTYEAIVKGENIPDPGTPESFKVLVKELQSLALDVELLDTNGDVVEIKENIDDQDRFSQVEKIDASKIRSQAKAMKKQVSKDEDVSDAFDGTAVNDYEDSTDQGYNIEEVEE